MAKQIKHAITAHKIEQGEAAIVSLIDRTTDDDLAKLIAKYSALCESDDPDLVLIGTLSTFALIYCIRKAGRL